MFERYDEDALNAVFHARGAVSEYGGTQLEPEHLVIGLLRARPEVLLGFASSAAASENMLQQLVAAIAGENRVAESHEIPLSRGSIDALQRARTEADDMSHDTIRAEHLVVGILATTTTGRAAAVLRDAGVHVSAVREALLRLPE